MFVRHGETEGNQEQIAHGQSESPLNDRGIEQALDDVCFALRPDYFLLVNLIGSAARPRNKTLGG